MTLEWIEKFTNVSMITLKKIKKKIKKMNVGLTNDEIIYLTGECALQLDMAGEYDISKTINEYISFKNK